MVIYWRRRCQEALWGAEAWTPTTMPLSAEEYNNLSPDEQKAYQESERKREREEQAG
jgi:hypothetical protein